MPFPKKLLNAGEDLHIDIRPHWWYFSNPAAALVVSLAALIYTKWIRSWDEGAGGVLVIVAAAVVVASLLWFVVRYLKWMTTNFVVTSHRVIFRSGVIGKKGIEIPLDRVNTVFFDQGIFERMIGAGNLAIESAGERGTEKFTDIRKPAFVQNEIHRLMEGEQDIRANMGRELSLPEQLEKLDDLRKKGIITDEEFATKKASLLEKM